jgi:hypothetical protein
LDVDHDVGLLDLEALKKLDYCAFVCGPRKSPDFDCTLDILLSYTVAATYILVLRVEALKLGVVLDVQVI